METFKVPDVSCGHCVASVTKALKEKDPAAIVRVDLGSKTVEVESTLPREVLAKQLGDAGYPAA